MALHGECQAERRCVPVEKPVAQVQRSALPGQLAAILETGNAVDVMGREGASDLDTEILGGHEFQFEFLVDRPVVSAALGKSSGRLALEFALAGIADIGADHEAEDMLGIDAFGANAGREQRGEDTRRSPEIICTDGIHIAENQTRNENDSIADRRQTLS